jgi:hypothetical protein
MEDKIYFKELDQMIEHLKDCKQLTEGQVKTLCDKVSITYKKKSSKKKAYTNYEFNHSRPAKS